MESGATVSAHADRFQSTSTRLILADQVRCFVKRGPRELLRRSIEKATSQCDPRGSHGIPVMGDESQHKRA